MKSDDMTSQVRQKSGEMTSPTPSIDSLNGALALCGDGSSDHGLDTFGSHGGFGSSGIGSSSGVGSVLIVFIAMVVFIIVLTNSDLIIKTWILRCRPPPRRPPP